MPHTQNYTCGEICVSGQQFTMCWIVRINSPYVQDVSEASFQHAASTLTIQGILRGLHRSFWVGTGGNAIPIVDKLPECMGMVFPMSECLRMHYGRHCEPFSGQSALDCRILHIQFQNYSGGCIPGPPQKRPWCWDSDTNFRLTSQCSSCSCFTKPPPGYSESASLDAHLWIWCHRCATYLHAMLVQTAVVVLCCVQCIYLHQVLQRVDVCADGRLHPRLSFRVPVAAVAACSKCLRLDEVSGTCK